MSLDISKTIPDYLVDKRNVTKLVLLTALFAIVFINIFEPFGSREWLDSNNDLIYLAMSSLLVIIGMAVVAISRIIMYYQCSPKHRGRALALGWYLAWIAGEVVFMAAAFVVLEVLWFNDTRSIPDLMKTASSNTALVLLLPYSLLWLYFSWDDKDKKLRNIDTMRANGEDLQSAKDRQQMIHFYDSKGILKFSVKLADFIYIKGADNYITIYYSDNQKVASLMVRNSMKQVEEQLKPIGIVRCHRSYIVNTKNIKTLEKQKEGFVVKLETPLHESLAVPVSKNYVNDVFELFGN